MLQTTKPQYRLNIEKKLDEAFAGKNIPVFVKENLADICEFNYLTGYVNGIRDSVLCNVESKTISDIEIVKHVSQILPKLEQVESRMKALNKQN